MKWVVKAAIQNVLSVMPYGGLMNYFLQRHASRTLPQPDDKFLKQVERASRHYRHFRQYVPGADGGDACFYEFGAGWDMTIPLIYRALGIQRQRLIDIRPILRMNLIGDTLSKITRLRTAVEELTGAPVPPVFESTAKMSDADRSVLHDFGIEYLAPHDARHSGFEDA